MGDEQTALVPTHPGRVEIASDINDARADQLVALDAQGNVTSMRRLMLRSLPLAAVAGAAIGSALALSTAVGGIFALPVVGAVVVAWFTFVRGARVIRRSAEAIARDDLEAAGDEVARLGAGWMPFSSLRGYAAGHAGAIAWRRGQLQEALAHTERAINELRPSFLRRAGPVYWMQLLNRVQLLAVLGRLEEADLAFRLVGGAPGGNWVELERQFTQLFLAFCHDEVERVPDDLHAWVRIALHTNVFGGNIVLLAWAYEQRSDHEMAEHLLRESSSRLDRWHLERTFPPIWRWMQGAQTRLIGPEPE